MASHSLAKILSFVDKIQAQICLPAIQKASQTSAAWESLRQQLSNQIQPVIGDIEAVLQKKQLSAADLAIRSRRAYQWLAFLSDQDSLSTHLDALQRLNLYLGDFKRNQREIRISFYHQGALFQVRDRGKILEMKIQESFINAPDQILKSLLEVLFNPGKMAARRIIKEYTFSPAYQDIRGRLEYLGVPQGSFSAGSVHDLQDSFSRVNRAYFNNKMDQPNLVWNNRLTHRKFGHYQWDTDTVMLSSSLDQPKVPDLVIDYVMYHELLHKKMGARQAKQNRIAHTAEFRKAESHYKELGQAKKLLNQITRNKLRFK